MCTRLEGQPTEPARRCLLQQSDVPVESREPSSELVAQRTLVVHVHGQVPAVEEVPAENPDYDALVTRHFLTGAELTNEELDQILGRALELKADRYASNALDRRTVALVFEKPSTRTRVSMEVAVAQLGGTPLVLRESETQLSRGESLQDFALVLSRYVDAIGVRTAPHETLETLAEHASVPVINLLTAKHHPCQVLADLLTLRERFGSLEGLKLAYTGDGNNMVSSLMVLGSLAG